MKNITQLIIATVPFIIVLILLFGASNEDITGNAFRLFSKTWTLERTVEQVPQAPVTAKPVQVQIREVALDGCFLEMRVAGRKEIVFLGKNKTQCESIYIAKTFNGRKDFNRLLRSLGETFDEKKLLDTNNLLLVYYKEKGQYDFFISMQDKFESNICESIDFFGIRLFCFNAVPASQKENNLEHIIPYMTVVRYTDNIPHKNMLMNKSTTAYDFILNENVVYYDASRPDLYGEDFESVRCRKTGGGPGNYQNRSGIPTVFICKKPLNKTVSSDPASKVRYAAILYHEAVHKHQIGHDYDVECHQTNGGNTGDRDFRSVYGAHINYLFSMADNPILECQQRQAAFDAAVDQMQIKLCQVPLEPRHRLYELYKKGEWKPC